MKILVLGKNGMLGRVVFDYFASKGNEVLGTDIRGEGMFYDAFSDMTSLEKIINDNKPEVIINCIGALNKNAEDHKLLAVRLNSELPHYIDSLSEQYNFKLIHVSTDCVFYGDKGRYDETSIPDAITFYGKSKALGEVNNNHNLTLRTSIIGPDNNPNGIGLFQWFINQTDSVNGYEKVIWTGVTTIELAKCMEKAIKNDLTGLHHVVNNDFISKYELLSLINKYFEKGLIINEENTTVSEKTLVRTDKSFDFNVLSYEDMIREMKEWVLNHNDEYQNIIDNCGLGRSK